MQNDKETAKDFLLSYTRSLGDNRIGTRYSDDEAEMLVAYAAQFAPKRPSDEEIEVYAKELALEFSQLTQPKIYSGFIDGAKWAIDRIFGHDKAEGE